MQKLEQAIRHALHKIDAASPAMRQKVYQTIWHAHEQSLASHKQLNNADKLKKRDQLISLLKAIEAEHRSSGKKNINAQLDIAPGAQMPDDSAAGTGPEEENFAPAADCVTMHDDRPGRSYKYSWLGAHVFAIVLLVITSFVIWSFYNSLTGADSRPENHQLSIAPMRQNDYSQTGWVQVFNPANVTSLAVQGVATAQVHNEADTNFVRISADKVGDAAIIEIGQGALIKLRGKTATFNVIARSASRKMAQLSLMCYSGREGIADRYRFEVSPTIGSFLFQVHIPQSLSGPIKLYITSDLLDQKREVDIFSVLVNTGN